MKKIKLVTVSLLIILLASLPAVADAHWRHGGRAIFGFGLGFATGYLFAPRPVYVAPPVYVPPPPPSPPSPYPYYVPAPVPQDPPVSGSMQNENSAVPPPGAQATCREWRMIDQHLEDRWDSYYGKWRSVPVEKWGWIEVPCQN